MTKIPNSKRLNDVECRQTNKSNLVLVIETGDPPAGWGVRRTNLGICGRFSFLLLANLGPVP